MSEKDAIANFVVVGKIESLGTLGPGRIVESLPNLIRPLVWSAERPTVPGWYFKRWTGGGLPDGGEFVVYWSERSGPDEPDEPDSIPNWAGPIPLPSEP